MSSSIVDATPLAREVEVTEAELRVVLSDGRRLAVPLAWSPRLQAAPPEARQRWELIGQCEGIHWPEADEDRSVAGLLAGSTSSRSS